MSVQGKQAHPPEKIIVTGASSGIGRATAIRFAREAQQAGRSCGLVVADIAAEPLLGLLDELRELGSMAEAVDCDLRDPASPGRIVDLAHERLGGLDLLVSNVGIARAAALVDLELSQWDETIALNTRAMWLLAKAGFPLLAETRGSIVVTASISGHQPTPDLGAYGPSKAALLMVVRQLALELAPHGIRVNSVSPGHVRSGMTEHFFRDERIERALAAGVPLGWIAQPDDIAGVIHFLAGPDAAYITGTDVLVDGGLSTALLPSAAGAVVFE
jgi:NAD(P)-dependent dehydrogenase (short-subunit alcohol dehydrogenase family)